MTDENAIDILKNIEYKAYCMEQFIDTDKAIDMGIKAIEAQPKWIPVKIREMTPEEIEELGLDNDITTMFDCELPDDGEEVLVTTPWGVKTTTFYEDYGCYFECYEDDGDVLAWMRLPKGYEPEQAQPHMMCEED